MAIIKYDNLGNSNNRSVFLAVLEVESPDSRHEQIIFLVSVTFLVPQLPFFCIFLRMGEMGEFSRTRMTRQSGNEHNGLQVRVVSPLENHCSCSA